MQFVHLINALGNDMWVAEDRVEEYLAAGHKLPAVKDAEKPAKESPKRTRKGKS